METFNDEQVSCLKEEEEVTDSSALAGLLCERCCRDLSSHLIGHDRIPMCCKCALCSASPYTYLHSILQLHKNNEHLWKSNIEGYWLKRLQREKEGGE